MLKYLKLSRKVLSSIPILLASLILLFAYQNCSPGFKSLSVEAELASSVLAPSADLPGVDQPDVDVPVAAPDAFLKIKSFDNGDYGTCHVTMDGRVVCFNGTKVINGLTDIKEVASSTSHVCGVNSSGDVKCVNLNDFTILPPIAVKNVVHIFAGIMPICLIDAETKVYCPVRMFPTMDFKEIPEVKGSTKIALGAGSMCFLNASGLIECLISLEPFSSSVISTTRYVDMKSTGYWPHRVCGLTSAGRLDCFDQGNDNMFTPVVMPSDLKPLRQFTFTNEYFGSGDGFSFCGVQTDDKIVCWGNNSSYFASIGDNPVISQPNVIFTGKVLNIRTKRTFKDQSACALMEDHTVRCWANGLQASVHPKPVPELDNVKDYLQLYPSQASDAYRLTEDGVVTCLRTVRWNLLGRPRDIDPCALAPTNGFIPFAGLTGVQKIVGSKDENYWFCALRSDGKVTCWGDSSTPNSYSTTSSLGVRIPSALTPLGEVQGISGAVDLVQIYRGNCILNTQSQVWCWGDGPWVHSPQFTLQGSPTPVHQPGLDGVQQVVGWAGWSLLVGLKDGRAFEVMNEGKADGSIDSKSADIPGATGLKKLVSKKWLYGKYGLCALTNDDMVKCWAGDQVYSNFNKSTPEVVARDIVSLEASTTHFCGINKSGQLLCFGSENLSGELATGDMKQQASILPSPLFSNVKSIFLGASYTCASDGGPMKCVGAPVTRPKNGLADPLLDPGR